MALLIYGTKESPIDIDELLVECPCCETQAWADVMVTSKYVHLYWIPLFPTEKWASIICKACGLKRFRPFDASLVRNYMEIKDRFKHPLFTYLGLSILSVVVASIVIAANL